MDKKTAIELLGGTPAKAAQALGYKTRHAIYVWPEVLSPRLVDRIHGALNRIKAEKAKPRRRNAKQPNAAAGV